MAGGLAATVPGTMRGAETRLSYPTGSSYDSLVLAHRPKLYYQYVSEQGIWVNTAPYGKDGRFPAGYGLEVLPNGERVPHFDGQAQFAEMPPTRFAGPTSAASAWTVECWVKFDSVAMPNAQADGIYVHWMGVGTKSSPTLGNHEWVARVYNDETGSVNRPRWVSGYAVKWTGGGLGCGQAYTDGWTPGTWHHYVFIIDHTTRKVGLWWDGVQAHGWVSMDDPKYMIELAYKGAPLRVGTRDFNSFLQGSVGKLATYTYKLSPARIAEHYQASPFTQVCS
jgi:hypothetical protein